MDILKGVDSATLPRDDDCILSDTFIAVQDKGSMTKVDSPDSPDSPDNPDNP